MRRLTRPWLTFIELASSRPAVIARLSSTVVRNERPWRSRAIWLRPVVVAATIRIPPPAAVARSSWSAINTPVDRLIVWGQAGRR